MNPRDSAIIRDVRLHRLIRRSTSYGPTLPDGVLDDDNANSGIVFIAVGAHLDRQFEFLKTEWLNTGQFFGAPGEKDPLVGPNDGSGQFTIPRQPIRRRMQDLQPFVFTRGGK
jgi:deferrochelatase/peroxidase EfeB